MNPKPVIFFLQRKPEYPMPQYSWPVVIDNSKVLVVYYITGPNGNRTISGTIVDVSTGKVN